MRSKLICFLAVVCLLVVSGGALANPLDLKVYSTAPMGVRTEVYEGPMSDYYRSGTAAVGPSTVCRIYGFVGDWVMIGYNYGSDRFRVGFGKKPETFEYVTEAAIGELEFECLPRKTNDACALTYDPVMVSVRNMDLKKGASVTVLSHLGKWDFVEVKNGKKLAWGFIYAKYVDETPLAEPASALRATGTEATTVLKELATKTPSQNYALFTGPGETYARARNGYASIDRLDKCKVYGTEGSWALVRHELSDGSAEFGWLPTSLLPDQSKLKKLSFDCVACKTDKDAVLTAVPGSGSPLLTVPGGSDVLFLAWEDAAHTIAYVEYKAGAVQARGFVSANALAF